MNAVDKDRQEDNGDRQEAMAIGALNEAAAWSGGVGGMRRGAAALEECGRRMAAACENGNGDRQEAMAMAMRTTWGR
jgi:hypothetical protein